MTNVLVINNYSANNSREFILQAYMNLIMPADTVLITNNNDTFTVLKNQWGKASSDHGFEVTFPMTMFSSWVLNPQSEGKKIQ